MKLWAPVVSVLWLGTAIVWCSVAPQRRASTAPPPTREQLAALGKVLFMDKGLSNPPGMGCVSCHSPATGYSYPDSGVNALFGTVPGAVRGRAGTRKPPSIAYAPYLMTGLPHWDNTAQAFVGGLFWDGRATDARAQVRVPIFNPVEMNDRIHGKPSPELVVRKIRKGPAGPIFLKLFGAKVFSRPAMDVVDLASEALVAYEGSSEVSPFTSKYDAYLEGKVQLSPIERLGMQLTTGTINGRPGGIPFRRHAHCMDCHALPTEPGQGPDLWTASCYANLGVPENTWNLGILIAKKNGKQTPPPDLGLGGFFYPYLGLPPGDPEDGDPLQIDGLFKAPSLRNVDKRPYPGFVKCYMHNGYFKSLKAVVHFYFTRNKTTVRRETVDFTKPDPYADLNGYPLWPAPEFLDPDTLLNASGMSSGLRARSQAANMGSLDTDQIGNLSLGPAQEDAIVAFLKTLSDGYFKRGPKDPRPYGPPPIPKQPRP